MIANAPRPDVAVAPVATVLGGSPALEEPPLLAVEILSPSDTPARRRTKEEVYLAAGLLHLAIVRTDRGTISISWYEAHGGRWTEVAAAAGDQVLTVELTFSLQLVPRSLLSS